MKHPKNSSFFFRLGFAWQGIAAAYRTENSFRTQARIALAVFVLLTLIRPGWLWTGILVALIGLVLAAELLNTALEALLDGLHPEQAAFVKLAKDAGAGAALVASAAAALAGAAMLADVLGARWE
jgi:diacylglycerol kinase (ATP)